jgi:hypothetical protein
MRAAFSSFSPVFRVRAGRHLELPDHRKTHEAAFSLQKAVLAVDEAAPCSVPAWPVEEEDP